MTDIVENEVVNNYNALLAVHQALAGKPVDFGDTVNHMLADRLEKAVENKREEVAKSIFNGEEPEAQADDSAPEEDTEQEAIEPELTGDEEESQPEE